MKRVAWILAGGCCVLLILFARANRPGSRIKERMPMTDKIVKSDDEWRKELTPEQFRVTRRRGTERAFTGEYWNTKKEGVFHCVCCGEPLFESTTKFDSGCGWPSFFQPVDENKIGLLEDNSLMMRRT